MATQNHIKVYHFINYQRDNLVNYLSNLLYRNSVICLDLEDSVQDVFKTENTPLLKAKARNCIREIFQTGNLTEMNWGIRLNSFHTSELDFDIDLLSELSQSVKIKSLLLPKTESKKEIHGLLKTLAKKNIEADEIIPVIETKNGFENLDSILAGKNEMMRRIAFGHCDYNYDIGIFPFNHQNSKQYWDWVKELVDIIESYGAEFVNSPFLKLSDDYSFASMLSKASSVCNEGFGQITLTQKQVELCGQFQFDKKQLNGFEIELQGKEVYKLAEKILYDFENNNECKGFSVRREDKTLISPHEYLSAKKYLGESDER